MKKVFLTLVAIATMGVANAQLFVGGNIGFAKTGGTDENTTSGTTLTVDKPKTTTWEITPKIGFQSGKMAFGLVFGVNGEKQVRKDINVTGDEGTNKYFGWEVCPFFRYNAFEYGNFSLFCELQVPIYSGKYSNKYTDGTTTIENKNAGKLFGLGVQVVPGLNYKLSDHFNFDIYLNLFALGYSMDKYTQEDPNNNDKTVEKNTELWAGVFSLPQHDAIGIGFNYNF